MKPKGVILFLKCACRLGTQYCPSPLIRPWTRSWLYTTGMASTMPDLRRPSQQQSVTANWPVLNYTAWWRGHTHGCKQLAHSRNAAAPRPAVEPSTDSLGDIWKHIYLGPTKPRRIVILCFALYKYTYLLTYLLDYAELISVDPLITRPTPYPLHHHAVSFLRYNIFP